MNPYVSFAAAMSLTGPAPEAVPVQLPTPAPVVKVIEKSELLNLFPLVKTAHVDVPPVLEPPVVRPLLKEKTRPLVPHNPENLPPAQPAPTPRPKRATPRATPRVQEFVSYEVSPPKDPRHDLLPRGTIVSEQDMNHALPYATSVYHERPSAVRRESPIVESYVAQEPPIPTYVPTYSMPLSTQSWGLMGGSCAGGSCR